METGLLLKQLLISLLIVLWGQLLLAQEPSALKPLKTSNARQARIPVKAGKITLDSLTIIPGSVRIPGLADSLFTIDWLDGSISFKQLPPFDSVLVQWRSFSTRLNQVKQDLNFDSLLNSYVSQQTIRSMGESGRRDEEFFNFGNINYSGSFGRGISFGNAQDAVVTSNLNMQINGFLGDSIEIAAAITDNNIPIQPDGTTQQLNEFDRIFLQFKKNGWQLSLGDIDIRQNRNYFLNFYKRLQGGAFENTSNLGKNVVNKSMFRFPRKVNLGHGLTGGDFASGKIRCGKGLATTSGDA